MLPPQAQVGPTKEGRQTPQPGAPLTLTMRMIAHRPPSAQIATIPAGLYWQADMDRRYSEPELITRREQIPTSFESEDALAEWWETHELSLDLLLSLPTPSDEELKRLFSRSRKAKK